jgi:hypothetical protein
MRNKPAKTPKISNFDAADCSVVCASPDAYATLEMPTRSNLKTFILVGRPTLSGLEVLVVRVLVQVFELARVRGLKPHKDDVGQPENVGRIVRIVHFKPIRRIEETHKETTETK